MSIQNYHHVPFTEKEKNVLSSRFIWFGEATSLSWNLFKTKFKSLFIPATLVNLLLTFLWILCLTLCGLWIYQITGGLTYIDPNNISAFGYNWLGVFGAIFLVLVSSVAFVYLTTVISVKTYSVLNGNSQSLSSQPMLLFKTLVICVAAVLYGGAVSLVLGLLDLLFRLPLIGAGISGNSLNSYSDAAQTEVSGTLILAGLFYGLYQVVAFVVQVVLAIYVEYVEQMYIYEGDFWLATSQTYRICKNYIWKEIARQFVFGLIFGLIVFVSFTILIAIAILLIASLISTKVWALAIAVGIIFGVLTLVISLVLGYVYLCFRYICFYNLRMLDLNIQKDIAKTTNITKKTKLESEVEDVVVVV